MKAFLSTTVIPAHLIPDAIRLSIAHVPLKTFNGCKMTGALLCIKNGNMPAREGEKKKKKKTACCCNRCRIYHLWSLESEGALTWARRREMTWRASPLSSSRCRSTVQALLFRLLPLPPPDPPDVHQPLSGSVHHRRHRPQRDHHGHGALPAAKGTGLEGDKAGDNKLSHGGMRLVGTVTATFAVWPQGPIH